MFLAEATRIDGKKTKILLETYEVKMYQEKIMNVYQGVTVRVSLNMIKRLDGGVPQPQYQPRG